MGKYILSVLGFLSLGWIIYVAINITSVGPALSPESVFHDKKDSIIVIHKPLEVDYTELPFQLVNSNTFYASVLQHTGRIQHFYFSLKGKTMLLERSKPWTIKLADAYFRQLSIKTTFTSAREMRLSNGWTARFDKEYLLIEQEETQLSEAVTLDWKYVDRKSTATIISWKNGQAAIENCYQKPNGITTYISTINTHGEHIADDQDLFLDVIPENFSEYTFYEKNYLVSIDPTPSLAYEWMNRGLVVVQYGNDKCIITDFISGQDPLAILGSAIDETTLSEAKTSGFVKNTPLPQRIQSAKEWYIEVFNNRVFIAEQKTVIDAFIGAYESGRTLSQNRNRYAHFFTNSSRKVSYRHVSQKEHRTISLLNNSRHTVLQKYTSSAEIIDEPQNNQLEPIRIDGGIAQLIPVQGSSFLYVVSKSGAVYGITSTEQRWKLELNEALIGDAVLSTNGNTLILTTASAVHAINHNGSELTGFPLSLSNKPFAPAYFYSWRGQDQLAIADNQLLTTYLLSTAKKTSGIPLPFPCRETPFSIWVNGGELTATLLGKTQGVTVSLDKKRKPKTFSVPNCTLIPVKTAVDAQFFGIEKNRLITISSKGVIREIHSGSKRLIGITKDAQQTVILVQSANGVKAFSENGQLLGTIPTSFNEPESASCLSSSNGKTVVGILDGLSNNNYIYGLNGHQLTNQSFEGASVVVLHRQPNGSLLLLSQSNGYLVRYPIE